MYPTVKQMKAIKKLERALKECEKENVFFHNCYGTLHAFDGNIVRYVDNDNDERSIREDDGDFYSVTLPCCEFSDDRHYIHLKDGD